MNYSNHVGIIGSGISGLTLGCCLLKFGIDCVIFEKSNEISKHGAGISISRNALKILDSPAYDSSTIKEDFEFVANKLDITVSELEDNGLTKRPFQK